MRRNQPFQRYRGQKKHYRELVESYTTPSLIVYGSYLITPEQPHRQFRKILISILRLPHLTLSFLPIYDTSSIIGLKDVHGSTSYGSFPIFVQRLSKIDVLLFSFLFVCPFPSFLSLPLPLFPLIFYSPRNKKPLKNN